MRRRLSFAGHARGARGGTAGSGIALLLVALTLACGDSSTGPADVSAPGTVTLQWNARARALVASFGDAPPFAGRLYALLSVAQHNAIVDAAAATRGRSAGARGRIERMAIATASAAILTAARPGQAANLRDTLVAERTAEGASVDEVLRADELGRRAAQAVLNRASHDAATDPWNGTLPEEEGSWREDHGDDPQLANWGGVTPWFLERGDQFRAPPPPTLDSDAFRTALAEVRHVSHTRTSQQFESAIHWSDGRGTATPPGHWNAIAAGMLATRPLGELETARILARMNMAAMDATIACWDSKYAYWLPRPWQVDTTVVTLVEHPPHPSYPSGHSCISAAAAAILTQSLPEFADSLDALAREASLSRLYAGLHYRFDLDAGMAIGRATAAYALSVGAPIPGTDALLTSFPSPRRSRWSGSTPAARAAP